MRATKNEEGAEIERLNKEVAALKRRLEKQAEGVISTAERAQLESKCVHRMLYCRVLGLHAQVDASRAHPARRIVLCRYKGDIEELEFAMKQTWEDKAKLSRQYEAERARLEVRRCRYCATVQCFQRSP